MNHRPIVIVGCNAVALSSLADFQPNGSVVVIDEPDVVRKRGIRDLVESAPVVGELIEWEYQRPGSADELYHARPDLRPAAIVSLVEYGTVFAARLAERHGLPGAGMGAASVMRDKAQLRRVTRAAGIANPASLEVDSAAEAKAFMAQTDGPVVLKPANRQAAVGTRIVRSLDEIGDAWDDCVQQDEGAVVPDRPMPLRMLVEQCIHGEEFSVELLVAQGATLFSNVTGKVLLPGSRPIELGHQVPATIATELQQLLVRETEAVLRAVGFGSGIVHCEWIVQDGCPYLVECAGRFAGDGIIELIERAYQAELVRAYYTVMRGEMPEPLAQEPASAAAVRFLQAEPGVVQSVSGLEAARAVAGVTSCTTALEPGGVVRDVRSSWDRIGLVIATGASTAEAVERAEQAANLVRVEVRSE